MQTIELVFTFFVIVLSKLILGLIACWMLVPRDLQCPACDAPLVPLGAPAGRQWLFRLLRLQHRWCMECGLEMVGRRSTPARPAAAQTRVVMTRWSQ